LIITFKFQIQKLIQFNSIQYICFRPQGSIPVVTNSGQRDDRIDTGGTDRTH